MRANTQNIVFFGTPEFAVPTLKAILDSGRKVSLVVTQPDKPSGRGRKLKPPPVKIFAEEHALNVIQPRKIRTPQFYESLKNTGAEVFVVVAYGRIFTEKHLAIPKVTLNVHASLLPRWRGASPIQRAIQHGDEKTGVSIMKLVEELDAGDVMHEVSTDISWDDTTKSLSERLRDLGGRALVEALDLLEAGSANFTAQNKNGVTFCPPIKVEEAQIDWSRAATDIHNQIRAFVPWPGAFTSDGNQRLKIWKSTLSSPPEEVTGDTGALWMTKKKLWVNTGDGWLEILSLQPEGKKQMDTPAFLAGYRSKNIRQWT